MTGEAGQGLIELLLGSSHYVIAHSFLMSKNVLTVSGFVRRRNSGPCKGRRSWSAVRARVRSSVPSRAQTDCHLEHQVRVQSERLRFSASPVPPLAVRPHCCGSSVHWASRKACIAVRRSVPAFGPMRHNPAAQRTRASGGGLQRSSAARRWLPR